MYILAYRKCKGSLKINVTEENDREIIKGSVFCAVCDMRYPITDGIPNLLPPQEIVTQS
jgi:uncharacterized protein YbaR (Trm112 family)